MTLDKPGKLVCYKADNVAEGSTPKPSPWGKVVFAFSFGPNPDEAILKAVAFCTAVG